MPKVMNGSMDTIARKIMTKEQIWELLEIHNLLCDTDQVNNHYGLNLFTAFIETYCLAIQEEKEKNV